MQVRAKVGAAVAVAVALVGGALAIRMSRSPRGEATEAGRGHGSSGTAHAGAAEPGSPIAGAGSQGSSAPRAGSDQRPRSEQRGITFGDPGSLAAIPARYELASIGTAAVAVRLAGGPPTIYTPERGGAPAPTGAVHGRVLHADGTPVAGAIVLVDKRFWLAGGHLAAAGGAVSDPSGAFEIARDPAGEAFAIAFDTTGWSPLVPVGTEPLELRLGGRGALHGRFTYDGHGESFLVTLEQEPAHALRVDYETDPDGRFEIASLPPGTYGLAAGLAQRIGGGDSQRTRRSITITAGQTTEVEIAQTPGTIVVLTAQDTPGAKPGYYEYWLFTGAAPHDRAAAKARAKQEHARGGLHGGVDADTPLQIHDVAAGSYVGCAATDDGAFGCTPVVVLDGDDVREIAIRLAR